MDDGGSFTSLVSSSFNTYCTTRMSQVCLGIPSDHTYTNVLCTPPLFVSQPKSIMPNIPSPPFSCCSTLKCFATAGSLGVDTQLQENQTSSSVWAPTDSKRSLVNPGRLKKPFNKDLEIKLQGWEIKVMLLR